MNRDPADFAVEWKSPSDLLIESESAIELEPREAATLNWFLARVLEERAENMPLFFYCLAYATGLLRQVGINEIDIARRFGISKSAVSQRVRKIMGSIPRTARTFTRAEESIDKFKYANRARRIGDL